jgi:asparagine synthetase B (glutamine-hydrolysing)
MDSTSVKLDELMASCAERVISNLEKTTDQLYLWWSGGLDSTAIAAALLSHPRFKRLVKAGRVMLCLTRASIEEYPEFYDRYLKHFDQVEANLSYYLLDNTVHVDGMWADELFGTYQSEHYPEAVTARNLEGFISRVATNAPLSSHFLRLMKPVEDAFQPETLFQRLWWLSFTTEYQDAVLRPYYNRTNLCDGATTKARIEANLPYRWFSHPDWISWAITRQKANRFTTYRESKNELRDYIFRFTGDIAYFQNKEKVYSQGELYVGFYHGISSDFTPF